MMMPRKINAVNTIKKRMEIYCFNTDSDAAISAIKEKTKSMEKMF
jgi:shikimate 5-dehydrogenase